MNWMRGYSNVELVEYWRLACKTTEAQAKAVQKAQFEQRELREEIDRRGLDLAGYAALEDS